MKRVLFAVCAAALFIPSVHTQTAPAQPPRPQLGPTQWTVDPSHSAANFSVRHMMVTTVRGQLGPIAGTVSYDGAARFGAGPFDCAGILAAGHR
jgi:polyisoprenoid-binding protein YceI